MNPSVVIGPDSKYGFVRFPDPNQVQRTSQVCHHHRFAGETLTGVLTYDILCQSRLFVGTNFDDEGIEINPEIQKKHFIKDAAGKPVIPGSTLKGHVRQLYESATHSCVFHVKKSYKVKAVHGETTSTLKDYPPFNGRGPEESGCNQRTGFCPTCRLFGYLKPPYRGRINIGDAQLLGEPRYEPNGKLPRQLVPRPKPRPKPEGRPDAGNYNDYFHQEQVSGRKVYRPKVAGGEVPPLEKEAQILKPNHTFRFTLHYTNLEPVELAALLRLLDLEQTASHLIGAAKAHGFGRCTFKRVAWRELDMRSRYLDPAHHETDHEPGSEAEKARIATLNAKLEQDTKFWNGGGYAALKELFYIAP